MTLRHDGVSSMSSRRRKLYNKILFFFFRLSYSAYKKYPNQSSPRRVRPRPCWAYQPSVPKATAVSFEDNGVSFKDDGRVKTTRRDPPSGVNLLGCQGPERPRILVPEVSISRNKPMMFCIRASGTNGPGRPVGHDFQSIGSPFHSSLAVVVYGINRNLSGEDAGWLPSSSMMADVSEPPVGCMVVSMFALDMFALEQISVAVSAWSEEWGREVLVPPVNESI
jgi:hypothetical protein